ncbi:MAG: hypothetical protein K2X27_06925 [Candidatus Obscuribacterales bacterium]|nr:hypothetical protein [Candidatus Obscuribacterales bacterium]
MRVVLSLSLTLLAVCTTASSAADLMDATASTQLRLLEIKYFEHSFDKDPIEDRVERIERLVRGDIGSGSPQDRIKSIASTLIADGESLSPIADADKAAAASDKSSGKSVQSQGKDRRSNLAYDDERNDSSRNGDTNEYPHVTVLEQEILGQTHMGEALPARLARMEQKAFGSAFSQNNDYGARTDKLEDYAERVLHKQAFAVNKDIDKEYIIPVSRSSRTSYPAIGLDSGSGPESAFEHFFAGSRRSVPNSFVPEENPTSNLSQIDEDPAVFQKDPPPNSSRMITRVGWCEMQVFGHTFSQMHLTQRLRQLYDEVRPAGVKQSDMQLMDDLDPIESAVIAKHGKQSLSSGSASPVR